MTYTPISAGTLNWDVPLNAGIEDVQSQAQAAQTTANTAETDAQTGITNAAAAQTSANTANTTANSALTLAGTANTTANLANNTANAAVPKDVQVFNVKDHGAVGNGVADDTTSIQNTISLATGGGIIYFPPGSYLLNGSAGLSLSVAGTLLVGAGAENTKILIGASFSDTAAVKITANNCQVRDLSLSGASGTTTSNPVANGIEVTGVRRFKALRNSFFNVNGWAIEGVSTNSSGTSNFFGSLISQNYFNACAGGIHTLGNTTQGFAVNLQISDNQMYVTGVTSGGSANLDGIRIEDSWDTLLSNNIVWVSNGTGSALNYVGTCAAGFIQNLDALGPTTGVANVILQAGTNGSPQNIQINGGVIQQGNIGLLVAGASNQVRVRNVRILNNQTHNVSVTSTGFSIYIDQCLLSLGGQGATGTNYDINWSGTADGFINEVRFGSSVTSTGVAGVQGMVNNSGAAVLRVINFNVASGNGYAAANWFTGTAPQFFTHVDATNLEYRGNLDLRLTGSNRLSLRADTAGANALAFNVGGTAGVDNARYLGDGTQNFGDGTNPRDTTWGRIGAAQIGSADSDIVANLAGKTLKVKSGTNAKAGTATLSGGTVTVSTTAVTANSIVAVSTKTVGGTPGALFVNAITAGTSFVIKSTSGTDTSVVNWIIIDLI